MIKYNSNNERVKREYYEYQKEANRKSNNTIDNIRKAIDRYERFTDFTDFKGFRKQKAVAFKKNLARTKARNSKKPLSKATLSSTLRHLKDFFKWLAYQKGFKKIDIRQIEYFNLSEKESREARGKSIKRYPSFEQIRAVLASMPSDSDIILRNRALIAFTALTGIRDGAMASLKLKHVKLDQELVVQRPDEVRTKFSKTIFTHFFPVGDDIKEIVVEWIRFLKKERLFNDNDPVFPRTKMSHNENFELQADGLEPTHWQSAGQIRKIFKAAFEAAGLEYYTPHSFRNMLVKLGEQICRTPEEYKAWSQSIGHEHVLTTFTSYGQVDEHRQGELLRKLSVSGTEVSTDAMIKEIYEKISQNNKNTA